jgi:L-threonylcarbamoyladenylate synthase
VRRDGHDAAAIGEAVSRLVAGELVAVPTETVYGLGARADDDAAVARIFKLKGRPAGHPLIVHVPDRSAADPFVASMPDIAERLIEAFWPGPLTVIVPRASGIAEAAAAGQPTIGLRCPAHPVAHALLVGARAAGVAGIAAPSANRFGRISPTTAAHVTDEFGEDLLVLDGGAARIGIESAIVDCSGARPALLRPGVLTSERIEAAAGLTLAPPDAESPRAPGSPRVALRAAGNAAPDGDAYAAGGPAGARVGAAEAGGIFPLGAVGRGHRCRAPAHAGATGTGRARIVLRSA